MAEWRKGKEIYAQDNKDRDGQKIIPDVYYCNHCGSQAYWDTDYGQQLFKFCPYCGTHMENARR